MDACIATLRDYPVLRTTYPNKVFDYMAAGRPIVLGIEGVIREVVEEAECGVCVPHCDPAAVAAAVRQLRRDGERAAAAGLAGREYVAAHFNRRQHAVIFPDLLKELVAGGHPKK